MLLYFCLVQITDTLDRSESIPQVHKFKVWLGIPCYKCLINPGDDWHPWGWTGVDPNSWMIRSSLGGFLSRGRYHLRILHVGWKFSFFLIEYILSNKSFPFKQKVHSQQVSRKKHQIPPQTLTFSPFCCVFFSGVSTPKTWCFLPIPQLQIPLRLQGQQCRIGRNTQLRLRIDGQTFVDATRHGGHLCWSCELRVVRLPDSCFVGIPSGRQT